MVKGVVEILYIAGCPNHLVAVKHVREALRLEGRPETIVEVEVVSEADAQAQGFLGSPTVRIEGQDVEQPARLLRCFGLSCRTYVDRGCRMGAPPVEWVRAAIRAARQDVPLRVEV